MLGSLIFLITQLRRRGMTSTTNSWRYLQVVAYSLQLVVDLLERLPMTNTFEGDQLYVKKDDGGVEFTQLTATLVSIALCDVLFAIDSIPAVVGISQDPFVVYTSNCFALLALRSLYVLLAKRCSSCTTCATPSRSSSASSAAR